MQPIDTVESRAAVMEDTTASVTATKVLFVESRVYLLKILKNNEIKKMATFVLRSKISAWGGCMCWSVTRVYSVYVHTNLHHPLKLYRLINPNLQRF
jgi:hypothetical protein